MRSRSCRQRKRRSVDAEQLGGRDRFECARSLNIGLRWGMFGAFGRAWPGGNTRPRVIFGAAVLTCLPLFACRASTPIGAEDHLIKRAVEKACRWSARRPESLCAQTNRRRTNPQRSPSPHRSRRAACRRDRTILHNRHVVGGMGSITGSAIAAMLIGVTNQFANYYLTGLGDFVVVIILAAVLLTKPSGLLGKVNH